MTDPTSTKPSVDERFERLLISPSQIQKILGKQGPAEVRFDQSEQGDARRRLLDVEKIARESKRKQAQSEAAYVAKVNNELHDVLLSELTESLSYTSEVFQDTLQLTEEIGGLIDALSVRVASVSKLLPHAEALPWLYDDLMQIVNSPRFRRKDNKGKVIVVETMKTALSFLGIENLRVLLPSLILKRAMPQVTDPYPNIKVNLTRFAHATSVTARELAAFYSLNRDHAYIFSMFSFFGRCAIIRLYFRLFDMVHQHMLRETQQDKETSKFSALQQITPSPLFLITLQEELAYKVSADMFEHLLLKRLPIAGAMRECAENTELTDGSLPKILKQASTYAQIRMLHRSKLVEFNEVKPILNAQSYPINALESLKSVDIFTLPTTSVEE